MKKMLVLSIIVSLVVLWAVSCGGGAPSTPAGPSTTTPPPQTQTSTSTTVNIVGSAGSGAFSPNPVQVPAGETIVWRSINGAEAPQPPSSDDGY